MRKNITVVFAALTAILFVAAQAHATPVLPLFSLDLESLGNSNNVQEDYPDVSADYTETDAPTDSYADLETGSGSEYAVVDFHINSFFDIFTEIQIDPGRLQVNIGDPSPTNDVTISGAGFQLSPTLIPLDQLNFGNYPDSSFTPLPSLDQTISPSGSESVTTPLPATVWMGLALLVVAAFARKSGFLRRLAA